MVNQRRSRLGSDGSSKSSRQNLWGGRFNESSAPEFNRLNDSFSFDYRLLAFDIEGSIAYSQALERAGVFKSVEARKVRRALRTILDRCSKNNGYLSSNLGRFEDVHSFVEAKLTEIVGNAGRKIHTGRSRNDQVALDFRLYLRHENQVLRRKLRRVASLLVRNADRDFGVCLPGYTHLQRAQPILLSHFWLAYFEMIRRDLLRCAQTEERINVMPLGSGALAGSAFPIDREHLAHLLGFHDVSTNSLDAVSDRDFAVEFLSNAALIMAHLSRLAEDLILYSTAEFGFLELSDRVASGSSIMPQKKNPDSLELIRGKTGRVYGNLQQLLVILKGLPMAYNKDLQEDKEGVFDSIETLFLALDTMTVVLQTLEVKPAHMRRAVEHGYLNATECADYLVRKGIPFRTAHQIVGRLVLYALRKNCPLEKLELKEFQRFCSSFGKDIYSKITIERSLESKNLTGGTSPAQVKRAIRDAKRYLRKID